MEPKILEDQIREARKDVMEIREHYAERMP